MRSSAAAVPVLAAIAALLGGGCRQEMYDQRRLEPFERSAFFPGGASARSPVPGTVAQGELDFDPYFAAGGAGETVGDAFPFEIDRPILERGRREYSTFCGPCHGLAGYGDGSIVRRGFPPPPSFHSDRMREKPAGHYVSVIANGFGTMFDYRDRVPPRDRWAIAAYIRVLQASQNASLEEVPPDERRELEAR